MSKTISFIYFVHFFRFWKNININMILKNALFQKLTHKTVYIYT